MRLTPDRPTPTHRALLAAMALVAVLAGAGSAGAAEAAAPAWNSLSSQQRSALAPLKDQWSGMDPTAQQKWLEVAARMPRMPAEERQRTQERMGAWASKTPAQRGQARITFQESRQVPRDERQAKWEAYQALPDDQKRELAAKGQPIAATRKDKDRSQVKSNTVRAPAPAATKSLAPTVVQSGPGATTTLVTKPSRPPAHQQTGLPKIAANPNFVDERTLMPKRGPQSVATQPPEKITPGRKPGSTEK